MFDAQAWMNPATLTEARDRENQEPVSEESGGINKKPAN
jgi:hypothetical protein